MMGTLRTSTNIRVLTVVLPALLAGVIEFCLVCLACGLCWCSCFWSVCFSLSSFMLCIVFSLFPPVHAFGGRRKGPCSFPLLSLVFLCPFYIVRSPCEVLVSWLRVLLTAAVWKICCYCKERQLIMSINTNFKMLLITGNGNSGVTKLGRE